MMKTPEKLKPARSATDESLRVERDKADLVIDAERVSAEEEADDVVVQARERAEEVLAAARDVEDRKGQVKASTVVVVARIAEDAAIVREQDAADERLRRERDERASLAALLPLEREKTNRDLITERGRADAALSHRDDFLGMVSHDLRSLLAGMAFSAEVLAMEASDSDEGHRTVEATKVIRRYVARMNRLVGDLVDVASIDAGLLALHTARCDARPVVQEAVDAFTPLAVAKRITLRGEMSDSPLIADLDRDRLFQVLANLITNAIKFTPDGGTVTVGGSVVEGDLALFVRDTGQGIPSAMLETVFERFWQAGKNDKRGIGLGLYISERIVRTHGGRIWAQSTVGVGTTMSFTLPTKKPTPTPTPA